MTEEIEMIDYHVTDSRGVYLRTVQVDPRDKLPDQGSLTPPPALSEGEFAVLLGRNWVATDEEPAPGPSFAAVSPEQVDAERDRRVTAGFMFAGKLYQSRNEDRENIAGAALAALAAQIAGAEPEDYRWHGGSSDFVWIAADNSLTPMDAQTMFAFGQAAMAHKQAHIFAARTLKDADPIPADYTGDQYWP